MSVTETIPVPDPELEDEEGGGRSRVFVLLVVLALLVTAGGGAWWFFLADREPPPPADGEVVVLPALTTTTGNSTLRHARIALGIVLVDGEDPEVVDRMIPLLQDALLREIAEMDADQLRSPDGSDQLRRQLTADAHDIWGEELVRRVILTELLVQ